MRFCRTKFSKDACIIFTCFYHIHVHVFCEPLTRAKTEKNGYLFLHVVDILVIYSSASNYKQFYEIYIGYTTKKLYIVSILFIYFLLFIFDLLDKYYLLFLCIERQQKVK